MGKNMNNKEWMGEILAQQGYVQSLYKLFDQDAKTNEDIFYDLCFCICAPQTTFKSNLVTNKMLREKNFFFNDIELSELSKIIKKTRFYNIKARRLMDVKTNFTRILLVVRGEMSDKDKRSWLVDNVSGLGMKAASHFLRNLGARDLAIIDTHIIKFMMCDKPTTKRKYLEIEKQFEEIAKKYGVAMGVLDALIWKYYSNTDWENFVF